MYAALLQVTFSTQFSNKGAFKVGCSIAWYFHASFNSIHVPLYNAPAVTSNPLPDMPISDSSNSAAKKDIMSKIWTHGDKII